MKKRISMILLLLCILGCKEEKPETEAEPVLGSEQAEINSQPNKLFDSKKWKVKDAYKYPYREEMLADLMSDDEIRAMKQNEVIELLGEPNRSDNGHFFYRIEQKRLGGVWPLHTKTLVIQFAADSTINWMKIHE